MKKILKLWLEYKSHLEEVIEWIGTDGIKQRAISGEAPTVENFMTWLALKELKSKSKQKH